MPAILALSGGLLASPQQKQASQNDSDSRQEILRVDVNLVTVGVYVTDRKNRAINGLVATDFAGAPAHAS